MAEPLYRQALELRQRVLGPDHTDTIKSIKDLAVCISAMGRWAGTDATELAGGRDACTSPHRGVCRGELGRQGLRL